MSFGPNTLESPFEIEDARDAQHLASERQCDYAAEVKRAHFALADAEYTYRIALSARIKQLHVDGIEGGKSQSGGLAITTCAEIAKGEESIATLRRERDRRAGELEGLNKDSFRVSADRRALDGLVHWSEQIQLRIDTPPADWDRQTGELLAGSAR